MDHAPAAEVRPILDRLGTLDREQWAKAFCAAAEPHYQAGLAAAAQGDRKTARAEYLAAFGLFRIARYPAPNSPAKRAAYRHSQDAFCKAAALAEPAMRRLEMPYAGLLPLDATLPASRH
jgi:esterase FrsA